MVGWKAMEISQAVIIAWWNKLSTTMGIEAVVSDNSVHWQCKLKDVVKQKILTITVGENFTLLMVKGVLVVNC